jgi:hypothetical protein
VDELSRATEWLLDASRTQDERLAIASPYLRLFGIAAGAALLARGAAARPQDGESQSLARFFIQNIGVQASALRRMVMESARSVVELSA